MNSIYRPLVTRLRGGLTAGPLAAGTLIVPSFALAQSAVVGSLGNFDAANFEGKDAHGMEIQIEGIQPGDLSSFMVRQ